MNRAVIGGSSARSSLHGMLTATTLLTSAALAALPPALPPAHDFARHVDNPWFPLTPGTVLTYRGESDGTPATDVFRVTRRTRRILGIAATVIDDRVYLRGRLAERTHDWYAQDRAGNVWYLGEDTATLKPNGQVDSTDGTWRVGVHGARAGIFMPAHPRLGTGGWQEFWPRHAEDHYRVIRVSSRTVLTRETTPLEPGVIDHKLYRRGVGTVREETVRGGNERFVLVAAHRP
jgi:hypothetical protein